MDLDSLQTLGAETWLNDHVINFIAKQVIQRETPDTHCYSSYSFSRLLHNSSDAGRYDFFQVRRWHMSQDLRLIGTIFNCKNLLVPINKDNLHWLLLHVNLESRLISLYDSGGQSNRYRQHQQGVFNGNAKVSTGGRGGGGSRATSKDHKPSSMDNLRQIRLHTTADYWI